MSAPMNEGDKKGQNKSFRKLFDYISKGNEKEQKIPMTTPVFARDGEGDQPDGRMYFVMPAEMKLKDVPKPVDGKLEISLAQQLDMRCIATRGGQMLPREPNRKRSC